MKAGTPFIKYSDMRDNQYRQRGGNPDSFPDKHPAYDISAHALPLGSGAPARSSRLTSPPSSPHFARGGIGMLLNSVWCILATVTITHRSVERGAGKMDALVP